MNEGESFDATPVVTRLDGVVTCGEFAVEPWPSLRMAPYRSPTFAEEIVRATPGSRFWDFEKTIPEPVRLVGRSAPAFRFSMIELCAANEPRALDLLRTCPALGVLIIASYEPDVDPDRQTYFRHILAQPWRKLLATVGLPTRPRTIRLLSKLPLDHCRWKTVAKLKILPARAGLPGPG